MNSDRDQPDEIADELLDRPNVSSDDESKITDTPNGMTEALRVFFILVLVVGVLLLLRVLFIKLGWAVDSDL